MNSSVVGWISRAVDLLGCKREKRDGGGNGRVAWV